MSLEHSPARQRRKKAPRRRIQPQPTPIEADSFYRAEALAARWGCHVMTIWQWARDEKIPAPIKIGPNVTRWRGADILAHEQSRG